MSAIPAPDDRAPDYKAADCVGAFPRTTEGGRLGLALVVIGSAQQMVVLDATIVNVALPHVQHGRIGDRTHAGLPAQKIAATPLE